MCSSRKYPPPTDGTCAFCFRPPTPPGISIPEGACLTSPPPPPPGIYAVALYYYAKNNIVSAIKREKILLFMSI